ncbi:hypothetical protein ACX40Y_04095 [Sphingomonas sp. RS6]
MKIRTDIMLNKARSLFRHANPIFLVTVVAPVVVAIIYFGFLASDVYISESKFVVRSPEKPAATGLGMILQTAGFSNASEEIFAAKAYVESRDALRAVNRGGYFEKAYSRPEISVIDRFKPFGINDSFEDLYRYYLSQIMIQQDSATSISTLTVRAFTAADAYRINKQLLEMAEATVNKINQRARQDLISYAATEVKDAKEKASKASLALAAYRNSSGLVDPEVQATAGLQMVSKLQDQLILARTQLRQLEAFTPANPQIPVLKRNIRDLQREMDDQMAQIAGGRGSLAASSVQYERLQLENQFAEKQLAGALASLEEARNDARRKQAYVERIVDPGLPDAPTEPRRIRGILATLLIGLVVWGIASMLYAGIREHGS